jgi:hypothetical protein
VNKASFDGREGLRRFARHRDRDELDAGSRQHTSCTRGRPARSDGLTLNALAAAIIVALCIACGETGGQATTNVQGGAARAPGAAPQQGK